MTANPNWPTVYACRVCHAEFATQILLLQHMLDKHKGNIALKGRDEMKQQYIIEFELITKKKGSTCIEFNSIKEAEEWVTENNDYADVMWDEMSNDEHQRVTNVRLSRRY